MVPADAGPPGPVRILLVEDDPLQQDILTTVFAL